jgi:anion-transporting  ArsA/GET3 family ATPase
VQTPLDRRFLIVTGKGGVGKTTTAACIALAAASTGRRVLVAMCNAKERLSTMLEVSSIGPRNVRILPHIDAVNMEPGEALAEYGTMILKVRALYRAVFENPISAAFLRATPGLEAWSMLGKAYYHTTETLDDGRPRYDLVILDAPATGNGLEMLRVPQVIVDVAPPGLLRREAESALTLFRDATRSAVVLVALPEELPTNETIELYGALRDELQFPIGQLVVNRVVPPLFSERERQALDTLRGTQIDPALASLVACSTVRGEQERTQASMIERLASAIDAPMLQLPRLIDPRLGRPELVSMSRRWSSASML